jgi:tetratricopeptide (TPR) repeat protein
MTLPKIFQKKTDEREVKNDIDPSLMPEPDDVDGYVRRGWMFHSRGMQDRAESDFQKALARQPDSVDATYVLGLVFKAQERNQEAIKAFQRVVELLDGGVLENKTRVTMLRRFALGHINEITTGDWNLEKQIWRRRS